MITNKKVLLAVDSGLQSAVSAIATALHSRNMNVRVVHGKLTEDEFTLESLKGGDLDKLNKARKSKELFPILQSNNVQTLSEDWAAITSGKAVVISPCYGHKAVNSNAQIDTEIGAVAGPAKITVERLDNGQNSVYFLTLAKKKTAKKKAEKNEDDKKG